MSGKYNGLFLFVLVAAHAVRAAPWGDGSLGDGVLAVVMVKSEGALLQVSPHDPPG